MGRKKQTSQIYASAFSIGTPEAIERSIATDSQVRFDTQTIRWGEDDDALPLRILQAINQSPVTTSCLGKVADYIQGSGFGDPGVSKIIIDKDGTTLGELHNQLSDYMAKLEGFSVRFTYDLEGRITNCFVMPLESCRFVRPEARHSKKISQIKYNPYWGTSQWHPDFTETYNVFEPSQEKRYAELNGMDADVKSKYLGQVYFYGNPRAPYKFYPVPKFWSGSHWIYVDAQVQTFMKKLLDNGFFQSTLITMVGDPTQPSKNPKYQKQVKGDDNTTRTQWDGKTTVGKEFEHMMQSSFAGADKAGKAMVLWAQNKDTSPTIQPFPVNANFDNISGTITNAIRGITIACEVPAILANLPQQTSSLGSDGESIRASIELMHARVREPQQALETFYNQILLPNLQERTTARVKIINHVPLSNQVQVPDKVWEWMNDEEKADFVRANVPAVKVIRTPAVPATTPTPGATQPTQATVNEAIKGLKKSEINRMKSISNDVEKGRLTYDQAKQMLLSYGLDEEQIKAWLTEPEEAVEP